VRNDVVVPDGARVEPEAYDAISVMVCTDPPGDTERALVRDPATDIASEAAKQKLKFMLRHEKLYFTVWTSHGVSRSTSADRCSSAGMSADGSRCFSSRHVSRQNAKNCDASRDRYHNHLEINSFNVFFNRSAACVTL
jgi:hypothetical protein